MEAYPLSIRKKIIELYRAGESTEEIADRYGFFGVFCHAEVFEKKRPRRNAGHLNDIHIEPELHGDLRMATSVCFKYCAAGMWRYSPSLRHLTCMAKKSPVTGW